MAGESEIVTNRRFKDENSLSGAATLLWTVGSIGAFVLMDRIGDGYLFLVLLLDGLALAASYFGKTMIEFRVFRHWLVPVLGVGLAVFLVPLILLVIYDRRRSAD
jgi:hypothetical protein